MSARSAGGAAPDDPIRIVYVVDNISFRGGERTFLQLATGLDRSRYRVAVACSPGGTFVDRLRAADIPVIPAAMRRKYRLDTVLGLAAELRRRRPHIVHTQGRGDPFGRLAGRLARVPAIVSTTAMIAGRYRVPERWRRLLYRAIDLATDRLVDRFIVVNRASVDALTGRHGIPRARVAVIPNGIEIGRYDPRSVPRGVWRRRLGIPEDAFLVGGLGRFTDQKGFPDLVRAFVPLADRGAWLAIGGDGPDREELEALVTGLGLEERVRLPGFVEDVPAFLNDLDLFVLSSVIEGHPMVLLEAMAMGVPVVATDIPGVGDTIAEGVDGRLVPPGAPDRLARAMVRMAEDAPEARRLGENARRKIEREYTVERMVERTEVLYREVLSQTAGFDFNSHP